MSKCIFGTYLGCVFLGAVSLYGQSTSVVDVVKNGDFSIGELVNGNWTPDDWTGSRDDMFSESGGVNSGGYAAIQPFAGQSQSISQTLDVTTTGEYKLSCYLKNTTQGGADSTNFQAEIDGTTWLDFLLSEVPNDASWALETNSKNLNAGSSNLSFSIPYVPGFLGNFLISNISLVLQTNSADSVDAENAVLQANGLIGNAIFTANNVALTALSGSSSATVVGLSVITGTISVSDREFPSCSGGSEETIDTKTINGQTYYKNSSDNSWYLSPPEDKNACNANGLTWDPNKKVTDPSIVKLLGSIAPFRSIIPSVSLGSVVSSIPVSTVFVNTGLLSTNSISSASSVKFLHAQIESANKQAGVSLDHVTKLKKELKQELAERTGKYNAISAKLGVSFEALDLNAFQDMDDLVAGRFNDFVLSQETNIQKLKREFRKDLAWFLHVSKSLEQIQAKIEKVTKEVSDFAEHHNSSIEKLAKKQGATFSKDLQVCISGLKKALGSLNQVYEKYSKGHDIVVSLKQKVDAQALKTQEILPKLYLLDMENASASLEADLQAELAMMDILDEEHLVAAKGMDPTRQIMKGAESGAVFDNSVNVWGRALGQYMHQSKSRTSSAFSSGTGGALMGADWKVSNHKLGFAGAYMYTYMGQAHNSGHVNINQGGLSPYGNFIVSDWKFDASIYGGYTHNNSHRNGSAGTVKYHAHSNSHAWQLAPHLQISYAGLQKNSWWTADPYVMGDYVANWQSAVVEKGSSSYNTKQKASFSGFIRTEAGFSFTESIAVEYGQLILREKAGWAYQRSLASSTSSVSIAGTTGAFVVPNNAFIQNLAVAEFAITFISPKKHVPNIEVSYEGQFGSKFVSQLGAVNLSKDF